MKYHIILDLDRTLIESFFLTNQKQIHTKLWMRPSFTQKDGGFVTYFRPYNETLLLYLMKHFDVSIWTTGEEEYAKKIVEMIDIPEENKKLFKFFLARSSDSDEATTFVDIISNKKYTIPNYEGRSIKSMEWLFEHKDFACNKNNTLLIDDNTNFKALYPENVLLTSQFTVDNENAYYDKTLWTILLWTKKHLFGKSSIPSLSSKFPSFYDYKASGKTRKKDRKKLGTIGTHKHNGNISSGDSISKSSDWDLPMRYVIDANKSSATVLKSDDFTTEIVKTKDYKWIHSDNF